jgi:hypothetical protein
VQDNLINGMQFNLQDTPKGKIITVYVPKIFGLWHPPALDETRKIIMRRYNNAGLSKIKFIVPTGLSKQCPLTMG